MSTIIAIDPGTNGGIIHYDSEHVFAYKMPNSETEIVNLLKKLSGTPSRPTIAVIERVGSYMPGNSGPASVKFARHVGLLEGALLSLNYRLEPPLGVLPKRWQSAIEGKPERPITKGMDTNTKVRLLAEYKRELKKSIKEYVQRSYPNIKVTLGNADALGILHWYLKKKGMVI